MARLKYGFLLKDILDRCQAKYDLTLEPDRSAWIYVGNDFTLSGLLNILGLYNVSIIFFLLICDIIYYGFC